MTRLQISVQEDSVFGTADKVREKRFFCYMISIWVYDSELIKEIFNRYPYNVWLIDGVRPFFPATKIFIEKLPLTLTMRDSGITP
jgi:hypothetical protein